MNDSPKQKKSKINLFLHERLNLDYPWYAWAVGWLAFLKALVWLSTYPVTEQNVLTVLGYKYIIFMISVIFFLLFFHYFL